MDSFRNTISKTFYPLARSPMKEALAEFIGTLFLVLCGNGVMASVILGRVGQQALLVSAFGWGFSLGVGIWISGRVSGGHLNPAVTTALAIMRKCPWVNVIPYLVAQYLASFVAASLVYFIYYDAITQFDSGIRQLPPSINSTAEIFSTYPKDSTSIGSLFVDQVVGTCLLLIVICAATDKRMNRSSSHIEPLIISLGLTAIILAFGHNCGAPLNPARDFSPRLFTAIAGWGLGTISVKSYSWFWIPIVAPHVGALLGAWLYDLFIERPYRNYDVLLDEVAISTDGLEREEEDRLRKFASKQAVGSVAEVSRQPSDTVNSILLSSSSPDKNSMNEGFVADNSSSDLLDA